MCNFFCRQEPGNEADDLSTGGKAGVRQGPHHSTLAPPVNQRHSSSRQEGTNPSRSRAVGGMSTKIGTTKHTKFFHPLRFVGYVVERLCQKLALCPRDFNAGRDRVLVPRPRDRSRSPRPCLITKNENTPLASRTPSRRVGIQLRRAQQQMAVKPHATSDRQRALPVQGFSPPLS